MKLFSADLKKKKKLIVVGIMSGTSLDGVDYVWCEINRKSKKTSIRFLKQKSITFEKKIRAKLFLAAKNKMNVAELAQLHFDLGKFYATALKKLLKSSSLKADLIGLHGQTVFHSGKMSSLQIGEPSFLAETFQVPVVSNFRAADICLGGQGAPLAPLFHAAAFGQTKQIVSLHNLGGISNLTLVKKSKPILAYDTGPANMPIDYLVQKYTKNKKLFDQNGNFASLGTIDKKLLHEALAHPYFKKAAPKSCGREEFGSLWVEKIIKKYSYLKTNDIVASFTEAVACSIAREYLKLKSDMPEKIIFCGGGSQNLFLMQRLQSHLPKIKITTSKLMGWPTQSIEGAAFALLASLRIWNIPVDLKSTTGAQKPGLLGQVTEI